MGSRKKRRVADGNLGISKFRWNQNPNIRRNPSGFSFIKDTPERDAESYKRRYDANCEDGKKGGRSPKKASASKTQEPKKPDNDNGNGNGNDIDNDIDIGNGNGIGNGIGNDMDIEGGGDGGAPLPSVSDGSAGIRHLSEEEKDLIYFFGDEKRKRK